MTDVVDGPPPGSWYRHRLTASGLMRDMRAAAPIALRLATREIRARYKQAVLGMAWAVITPVVLMLAFTLLFRRVATVRTEEVPYALFSYLGLVPWQLTATAINQGGVGLLANNALVKRVACPPEAFVVAPVGMGLVDAGVASGVLVVLFTYYSRMPELQSLWVPVLLLIQLAFTIGLTFVVAIAVVYVRDVRHVLPLAMQVGLFTTPVAYGIEQIPEQWRTLYQILNPLAPVIDGYRQTVLHGEAPSAFVGIAAITSSALLVGGYLVFKRLETGITDVS